MKHLRSHHQVMAAILAPILAAALPACGTNKPQSQNQTAPTEPGAGTAASTRPTTTRPTTTRPRTTRPQTSRPAVRTPSTSPRQGDFTPVSQDWLETLAQGIDAFSLNLYKAVASRKGNLFFSPWSISMALAMTHLGARGKTAAEMEQALHFPDKMLDESFATLLRNLTTGLPKGIQVEMANRIFPQQGYPLLPAFTQALGRFYATGSQALDFVKAASAATNAINSWVKAQTHGRITNLIPQGVLDSLTRLVLVNTIFFKGTWKTKFKKRATHKAPFYPSAGQTIQVDMMGATIKTRYQQGPGFKVLSLPYVGDKLSMVILLPDKKDGLADLEKKLDAETIHKVTRHMPMRKVRIWLPRFHAEQKLQLKPILAKLGIKLAFSQTKADFSGITTQKPGLFISAVIHQADCDVDEQGTVAAAATAVVMKVRGRIASHPDSYLFRADHPFLFFIRDDASGAILFMGRIVKP